jgi:hypothetical protein
MASHATAHVVAMGEQRFPVTNVQVDPVIADATPFEHCTREPVVFPVKLSAISTV